MITTYLFEQTTLIYRGPWKNLKMLCIFSWFSQPPWLYYHLFRQKIIALTPIKTNYLNKLRFRPTRIKIGHFLHAPFRYSGTKLHAEPTPKVIRQRLSCLLWACRGYHCLLVHPSLCNDSVSFCHPQIYSWCEAHEALWYLEEHLLSSHRLRFAWNFEIWYINQVPNKIDFMMNLENRWSEAGNRLVSFPSENGWDIALFQGPFAEKRLSLKGIRLGARYRLYKRNRLSGNMKPLDRFVDIAGISEDSWGIRSEDAQSQENAEWYQNHLEENPRLITVWGHHNGSTEVWVLERLDMLTPQEDGSISMRWGFYLQLDEQHAQEVVSDSAGKVEGILAPSKHL